MSQVVNLLERPVYGMAEVDNLLGLRGGTARRWIDGYVRGGKSYPPVVREEATGNLHVTWGEFVETRYLAAFRETGVPMIRLRPAIEKLRVKFNTKYPLAFAKPFTDGQDLVMKIQDEVGLENPLRIFVVRSGQTVLSDRAGDYFRSVDFGDVTGSGAVRLRPVANNPVVIDPLRQHGAPVVRSVPTAVLVEMFRAGDGIDTIAALYELSTDDVSAAIRYEMTRGGNAA